MLAVPIHQRVALKFVYCSQQLIHLVLLIFSGVFSHLSHFIISSEASRITSRLNKYKLCISWCKKDFSAFLVRAKKYVVKMS